MKTGIDIITNYFCNFSCEYCFLHKLKDIKKVIDIDKLQRQLEEVSSKYKIDNINFVLGNHPKMASSKYHSSKLTDLWIKQ